MHSSRLVLSGFRMTGCMRLGALVGASVLLLLMTGCGSGTTTVLPDDDIADINTDNTLPDPGAPDTPDDVQHRPDLNLNDGTTDLPDSADTPAVDVDVSPPDDPGSDPGVDPGFDQGSDPGDDPGPVLSDPGPPDVCQPSCLNRECGDDGCAGTCGTCTGGKVCQAGLCICVASGHKACCDQAVCWVDSCGTVGEKVADCPYGCADTACQECVPNCLGKECGPDGCGGVCGVCPTGACDGLSWTPAGTCSADGVCVPDPVQHCDDGNECTTDTCDAAAGCAHGIADDGTICVPGVCNGLTWVWPKSCLGGACVGDGESSCDDEVGCTTDTCDPAAGCSSTLLPGTCLIDGACVIEGTTSGKCLECVPLASADSWTYVTSKACDDIDACTADDQCASGGSDDAGCAGTAYSCDDNLACTTDACDGLGGCSNTLLPGLCMIDGACYADGQSDAANACSFCAVDSSPTAWAHLADWTSCGEGMNCQAGSCVENACPPGYAFIPPGTFTMGSPETEPGRNDDETQHEVTISQSFCMKTTEVLASEWLAVVGNNPSDQPCEGTCPVEAVSWWDAVWYCNQRSVQEALRPCYTLTGCAGGPGTGRSTFHCSGVTLMGPSCTGYRLPTEAEWEYAARAGTTTATYNGTSVATLGEAPNSVLDPIAWFCGNSPTLSVQPVKGKQANAWGLYDMLGNVFEHCWDWYGAYPAGSVTDPSGATTGTGRLMRGGSWATYAYFSRAAWRSISYPSDEGYRGGFRTVRATCGGVACPTPPRGTASCNAQQECEYTGG